MADGESRTIGPGRRRIDYVADGVPQHLPARVILDLVQYRDDVFVVHGFEHRSVLTLRSATTDASLRVGDRALDLLHMIMVGKQAGLGLWNNNSRHEYQRTVWLLVSEIRRCSGRPSLPRTHGAARLFDRYISHMCPLSHFGLIPNWHERRIVRKCSSAIRHPHDHRVAGWIACMVAVDSSVSEGLTLWRADADRSGNATAGDGEVRLTVQR